MDDLLSPASTKYLKENVETSSTNGRASSNVVRRTHVSITSPDEAVQTLRSKPDLETLKEVLRYLDPKRTRAESFDITVSGPKSAQLVHVLVSSTLPDFWQVLTEHSRGDPGHTDSRKPHGKELKILLRCLRSVTGLGASLAQLRVLLLDDSEGGKTSKDQISHQAISELLEIICLLLEGDSYLRKTWTGLKQQYEDNSKALIIWKELVSLLAGGRLLSFAAQASVRLEDANAEEPKKIWVGDGASFSAWLGRNVADMALHCPKDDPEAWRALAQLLGKAMSLGYTDQIVEAIIGVLIHQTQGELTWLGLLVDHLMRHEQRKFLYCQLRTLSRKHLSPSKPDSVGSAKDDQEARKIAGAAAMIMSTVHESESLKGELLSWMTHSSGGGVGEGVGIGRAVVVVLSNYEDRISDLLKESLKHFGDKLYISQTPILQQEVNTQILLLAVGYVFRRSATTLRDIARSSSYLNAISNRLSAPSERSRILGMLVGTAISDLIDKADTKMVFSMDELDTADSRWFLGLTKIKDSIGSLTDLRSSHITSSKLARVSQRAKHGPAETGHFGTSTIISIEDVTNERSDEDREVDEEFPTYAKPDSDPDDSDDDATLVQRNKPTAPVYIRDLIVFLRNTESYDHQRLGLSTAASLIRRKAQYGTEVSDHLEELASLLVGLADKFEMIDFDGLRLQAMIAILIARPLEMGQWFSKTFFDGDYSIGQRASVLNALGLGARELAELITPAESQALISKSTITSSADDASAKTFPSKKLPPRLHALYSSENASYTQASPRPTARKPIASSPIIETLATRLQQTMITPLAVSAADQLSGPNVLKVRTFSSRMNVEKNRGRPKSNQLSKIVAVSFIFPLTGRWWAGHRTVSTSSPQSFRKELLPAYLHTLAIILHAASPSTPSLPDLTNELFPIILALFSPFSKHEMISTAPEIEPLLLLLLTVLDINLESPDKGRGMVQRHARELDEVRGWTEGIFEAGVGEEKVRMLAASIMLRLGELSQPGFAS